MRWPLVLIGLAVLSPATMAIVPHSDRHPYDDLPEGSPVGAHYPGYVYDAGVVTRCDDGRCAAVDERDGAVTLEADPLHLFTRAEGVCLVRRADVTIVLTDIAGDTVRAVCRAGYGQAATFVVVSYLPAARIGLHGPPGDWGLDVLALSAP